MKQFVRKILFAFLIIIGLETFVLIIDVGSHY